MVVGIQTLGKEQVFGQPCEAVVPHQYIITQVDFGYRTDDEHGPVRQFRFFGESKSLGYRSGGDPGRDHLIEHRPR